MLGFWYFACAKIMYSPQFAELLSQFESVDHLWDQISAKMWYQPRTWPNIEAVKKQQAFYGEQKQSLKAMGIDIITFDSDFYPTHLKHIYHAPLALFVRGNKELLQGSCHVSIVGTRQASAYGLQMTASIVETLSSYPIVFVSGLAYGIDTQVHLAADRFGKSSVGVIPAPLLAKEWGGNKVLKERLPLDRHLFLSETLPNERLERFHFAKRNRLIAGCSLYTIVIEAPADSGALITARYALDEGREILTIPHTLINAQGKGCLNLLAQGATFISDLSMLPQQLGFKNKYITANPHVFHNKEEAKIYELLTQGNNLEEIIAILHVPSGNVLLSLGSLMLQGYVTQNAEGEYTAL